MESVLCIIDHSGTFLNGLFLFVAVEDEDLGDLLGEGDGGDWRCGCGGLAHRMRLLRGCAEVGGRLAIS